MAEGPVNPSHESVNAGPAREDTGVPYDLQWRPPLSWSLFIRSLTARIPESVTIVVVFFLVLAAEAVAVAVVSVVVIQGAKLLYALSGRATKVWLRAWRYRRYLRDKGIPIPLSEALGRLVCPGSGGSPRLTWNDEPECPHCWQEICPVDGRVPEHEQLPMYIGVELVECDPRITNIHRRELKQWHARVVELEQALRQARRGGQRPHTA